jgi:hypothetical protein
VEPALAATIVGLAGFNLGIEAAQIGVAALAGLLVQGLKLCLQPRATQRVSQFASGVAMVAGSFWFIQRAVLSL